MKPIEDSNFFTTLREHLTNMPVGAKLKVNTFNRAPSAVGLWVTARAGDTRSYTWVITGPREIVVTRGWNKIKGKYGFDKLEVGESMLVCAPQSMWGSIRTLASGFQRTAGRKFTCKATPEGLLVTRGDDAPLPSPDRSNAIEIKMLGRIIVPTVEDETASDDAADEMTRHVDAPEGGLRYGLDTLEVGASSFVSVDVEYRIANLRQYCRRNGQKLGRKFKVTAHGHILSEDGGHIITRTA